MANNISKYNSVCVRGCVSVGIFIMGMQVRRHKCVVYTQIQLSVLLLLRGQLAAKFFELFMLMHINHTTQNHNISGSFIAETGVALIQIYDNGRVFYRAAR